VYCVLTVERTSFEVLGVGRGAFEALSWRAVRHG
jgi:hypothetical protein